ncbi:hypothetical protein VNI00_007354 [Paramarasmius palmivorus]|uniref:Uncharacterized protein n=1 Tax=Paramarasmius palmivorus TaxID=297713 RepID=A0AAW0D668_9AGAR
MEYKKGAENILAGMNQARFYLVSACRYLASLGIFDFPVFAVATQGFKGRLLCAWSIPPDSENHKADGGISAMYDGVYMADTNCPEWDITDPSQAVKFAMFLISLKNNYVPELLKKFKEVEEDIKAELAKMDDKVAGAGERFKWAVTHQRKEGVLKSLVDLLAESEKAEQKSKKRRVDSEVEVPPPP